jgi:hypothetical protein
MRSESFLLVVGLVAAACGGGPADRGEGTPATVAPSTTVEVGVSTTPPTVPAPVNLALEATAAASSSLPDQPLSMIRDGIRAIADGNWWGAGDFAPQWVEFDLGVTATIERVELVISQSPSGETVHQILGRGGPDEEWRHLETISGGTSNGQTLTVESDRAWRAIRFLRVETLESPSWVAWGEVEIWGLPSTTATDGTTDRLALPADGPDLILWNAKVITVDAAFSRAEALAVRNGLVEAVGSNDEILDRRGQTPSWSISAVPP